MRLLLIKDNLKAHTKALRTILVVACVTLALAFSAESAAIENCDSFLRLSSQFLQGKIQALKQVLRQNHKPDYASRAVLRPADDIGFVLYRNSIRTGAEWAIFEALDTKGKVLFHSPGIKGEMDEVQTGPALFDFVAFMITSELADQVVAVRKRHTHPTSIHHEAPDKFSKEDLTSDLDAKAALDFVFPGKFKFLSQIIFRKGGEINEKEYSIPAEHTAFNGDFYSPVFNSAQNEYGLDALKDPNFGEIREKFLKIGQPQNVILGNGDTMVIALILDAQYVREHRP